jgi:hypothetical protein
MLLICYFDLSIMAHRHKRGVRELNKCVASKVTFALALALPFGPYYCNLDYSIIYMT